MRELPDSEWQLFDVRKVTYLCPRCLHEQRVRMTALEDGNAVHADVEQPIRDN
jgi:hypothetical protein